MQSVLIQRFAELSKWRPGLVFLSHISLPRGSTSIAEASWTVERSGERGATAAGNQAFSNSVSETKKRSSYFKHANTLPVRQLPFEAVDQGGNKSSCLRKDRFLFTLSADHSISCWFSAWTLCRQHRGSLQQPAQQSPSESD